MALQHSRSRSFPSRSEPFLTEVDEGLLSETTPSSLPSLTNRIKGVQDLHERIDVLLQQPRIQRMITSTHERPHRRVDEITDGYITLLDACSATRDLISLAKGDSQELLSGVRRRGIHSHATRSYYLTSRRNSRKKMAKRASFIRRKQRNGNGNERSPIESLLMDAETATLAMLVSIFTYTMGTSNGRSLVAKLVDSKKAEEVTEFTKVDAILVSMIKSEDGAIVGELLIHLREMESTIQILEDSLECLFRQLIKTRVLLLNILSDH